MPFQKGQSGNPGGRPAQIKMVRDLAREHTPEVIERLVEWMRSENPSASVAASNSLLDRAWGKPVQPIDGDGDGAPVKLLIERVILDHGRDVA